MSKPNKDYLTIIRRPKIYAYTTPQYDKTPWERGRRGRGLIKVGYTQHDDVNVRVGQQFGVAQPRADAYKILLDENALREDGTFFNDKDVHAALKDMGVAQVGRSEWFECTIDEVRAAVAAVRARRRVEAGRVQTFGMRPEQARAVEMTAKYFKENSYEKNKKVPHFLWNAKMRFGKTFTAYKLAQKMGWKKVLVLTFKPAVENSWREDLETHIDFKDWQFISRNSPLTFAAADKSRPIVWFASFQDVLGKDSCGGIKPRNEDIRTTNWDCVILDEYHFGAWRERARDLFEGEDLDDRDHGGLGYYDEDLMPVTAGAYLYLSGTPFRALSNGEFLEDQIFNWTYGDEQRAKEEWGDAPGNPYLELPKMVLMTYQLPEKIREIALKGEANEFDLNEFFKAEEKENGECEFRHPEYVQKWLDLIRGQYLPAEEIALKDGARPPMPYSDIRLQSAAHTLWFLPNVAACRAMAALLRKRANNFFHSYKIVVCAGIEAGVGLQALGPVVEAIGDPFATRTITLTCGKLLTGVTQKAWGAIFMLRNTTSPETYFQAAFRVQSPWVLRNPDGKSPNAVEIVKETCYVFDFAPDRALSQIADYSSRLDLNSEESVEKKVADFIHFLPVLCYDGSSMRELNAGAILDFVATGTGATLLARQWEHAMLVNVDNDTLARLRGNSEAMEALGKIEGFRNLNQDITTILNRSNALKKSKRTAAEGGDGAKRPTKRELTAEEKELKSMRKRIQEKLLKFASRIPVFMYLTDYREHTLKDIITQLEPELFQKVTGLEIKDFELLISLGVFNAPSMNSAIFAFKRFEEASLSYTGIAAKAAETVGGWDTAISVREWREMR